MNHKLYKNIVCALILACSTQTSDLQCGWFGSITGQIAAALTGIKKHPYITCGLAAITALFGYQIKQALRPWWQNDLEPDSISDEELDNLKPFASKKELRQEYKKLWEREATFSSRTEAETISKHYKDLLLFYQQLFRYIVVQDIKKKLEYTVDLGFSVTNDNELKMERLPAKNDREEEENKYLFQLSVNPNDKEALKNLKDLIEERSNKAEDKNTATFFPDIVLLYEGQKNSSWKIDLIQSRFDLDYDIDEPIRRTEIEIDPRTGAFYAPTPNQIVIRKKSFSIHAFGTMVHEFTHRLQWAQGPARGGSNSGLLNTKATYATYPIKVATEAEAEIRGLSYLPKQMLLETKSRFYPLFNRIFPDCFDKFDTERLFPYFTSAQKHGFLVEKYKFPDEESYKTAGLKAYEIRKKIEKQIVENCLKFDNLSKKDQWPYSSSSCLRLVQRSCRLEKDFEIQTIKLKIKMLKQNNLTEEQKKKIESATNYPFGSPEFFKLKQKLGLMPKSK